MRSGLSLVPTFAVTCAAVFAAPLCAQAQAAPPQQAATSARPDEGALRYYAQQGQKSRVEAELRRLQTLQPGYQAPADLYKASASDGSPEDQSLWDLFGQDKLEELKAGIAARLAEETGWQAPADLLLKIRIKETRRKMIALSGDQQWKRIIQLAKEEPSAVDPADVELMWALAESYDRAKQNTEALAIYTTLLTSNEKPEERLATLQKSMGLLRMADVETLYALGRKDAAGANEFDVILNDLTRARISAFLHDERKDNLNQDHVKLFADYAKGAEDPNQPGLVGWYHYKRREFAEALEWFKYSLEKGGDAKIAHGLAHSLRQLRKFREAEEVAYAWRDYDVANKLLFVDLLEMDLTKEVPPYIEDERLARYGKLAADDASGEGAQALAWYAYNSCQYFTALEWFQRANAWLPKEATAYGLALTYRRLGDRKNFVETVNRYDGLFPKVVALVFPDDRYLPPTPCEEAVLAPVVAPVRTSSQIRNPANVASTVDVAGVNGGNGQQQNPELVLTSNGAEAAMPNPMTDPTIAYPIGTAPNYPNSIHDPLWRYSWGRVPSPTGQPFRVLPPNYRGEPWQPAQFNPNEFPVMINPQNPLRFLATGAPTARPAPAASDIPAPQLAIAREPTPPIWPLLARKVPGVLPMPYETNGFTLQYVSIPDPKRKGAFIQTLRFVPPLGFGQNFGSVWNQPRYGQPLGEPALAPQPAQRLVQFAPGSALQPVSLEVTASVLRPRPPEVAPQPPVYQAPAPSLLPPGYVPLLTPMPAQNYPAAVANPYGGPQAYSVAPAYAPATPPQSYPAPASPYGAPQAYPAAPAYYPPANGPQPAYAQPQTYPAPQISYGLQPQGQVEAIPAGRTRPSARHVQPKRYFAVPGKAGNTPGCGSGRQSALNQGWCLLNADRPQEAALAFGQAMQAGNGKTREDAAYGRSLADLRSNLTDSALQSANSAPMSPKHRNEIGVAVLAQRALGFYNQGSYREALNALDQRMAHVPETRDLSMMRGWCLYHLGRLEESERLFSALDHQTSTKESRQGLGAIETRMAGRNR